MRPPAMVLVSPERFNHWLKSTADHKMQAGRGVLVAHVVALTGQACSHAGDLDRNGP